MSKIMKKKTKVLSWLIIFILFSGCLKGQAFAVTKTSTEHTWYSQKGWTYNGKALTSMCYITSYAMLLTRLGINANPVDVYVANGASNYANHVKIGNAYNVDTSETGSLSSLTNAKKEEKVKELLGKYPQGIIVGGYYEQGSTHYIVASKVVNGIIYFDDPAFDTKEKGCCITIGNVWKLNWSNISVYRVVKSTTSNVVTTPTPTIAPTITPTIAPTAAPNEVTIEPSSAPQITASPTATPQNITEEPEYQIPTRTLYYKSPPMTGSDVKWLQNSLKQLGYSITESGTFDTKTKTVVITFQKENGLSQDGYVGALTREKIISELNKLNMSSNTVSIVKRVTKLKVEEKVAKKKTSSTYTAKANWKKLSDVDGYQVIYSLNKDFKASTSVYVTKNKTSVKKLKKAKRYYFKVRAYKTVNKKKVYGKYCVARTIKVKKTSK